MVCVINPYLNVYFNVFPYSSAYIYIYIYMYICIYIYIIYIIYIYIYNTLFQYAVMLCRYMILLLT